ncbi:hypothetical protein ACO34A_08620 [Rhizobium sp. ACO-34A]|nr:hypothetical protein [Rhizobium sp. ACO-34A]ATN33872.1 hypothetical protein ACO34A_08620 [Rhizobium sp. ACO-34A]
MSGILPSRKLVGLVIATAVLALATADLRRRGFMSPSLASAIAISLLLINLALCIAGLMTRQKLAWGLYLLVSLATSLVLGFATPVNAALTLLPLGIGALLDLIHASGRPW